jgi:TolB-like protein/Tfp pilus assembly protein PilF
MSLFGELKRRNVFRVGIAYVVTAWLLLQVADIVLDNTPAPDWVMHVIMLLLAIGFPLALLFAWAFEMTPEGLKKEKDVDRSKSITHSTGRKLDFAIIAVLVVALGYFAYDKFAPGPGESTATPTQTQHPPNSVIPANANVIPANAGTHSESIGTAPDRASGEAGATGKLSGTDAAAPPPPLTIAVLPFTDMSPNKDQEYLSDGLAEELLNLLAKIPDLRVTSRTSAFFFKGQKVDIPTIAQKLNVAHILEGSVRKSGNQVRITAQLIDVASDTHLWSDTFDRTLDDVFAIQDEIATSVVEALKITLLGEAPKVREVNPDAYALFLRGRYFKERLDRESLETAQRSLMQALEIEPEYAMALVELADVYSSMAGAGFMGTAEFRQLAGDAVDRALVLDDKLAEAHAQLGAIRAQYDWDWKGAYSALRRALALSPASTSALRQAAVLARSLGRYEEALEMYRTAIALDPLQPVMRLSMGTALSLAGKYDEALAMHREALEFDPRFPQSHMAISSTLLLMERPDEALAEAELEPEKAWRQYARALALIALDRQQEAEQILAAYIDDFQDEWAYQIAVIYGFMGKANQAFEWLDRAYDQRDGGVGQSRGDPFLAGLHGDPRWLPFLQKVGISDEQVAAIFNSDSEAP